MTPRAIPSINAGVIAAAAADADAWCGHILKANQVVETC